MSNIVRNSQEIIQKLIISETVSADDDWTSDAIDLTSPVSVKGTFSIQVEATGDGTATIEVLLSNNGVDFVIPTGSSEIVTGLTKTTNTDGKDIYPFTLKAQTRFMKIKITETGTSSSITIDATVIGQ